MSSIEIARIFGLLAIVSNISSMQFKKREHILIALFLLNLFSALNLLFLGSITSSYICFFAEIEMIINYIYERKGKVTPKWVVGIYIVINIILGMLTYKGILDILPIACAIIYCGTILTKKEQNIRKLMLANQSTWLVYDSIIKNPTLVISNILSIISISIALFRYKKKKV